jgi:ABC-2 type transport system permease protein
VRHRIRPGLSALLRPKVRGRVNRARQGRVRVVRAIVLGGVALLFWSLLFVLTNRMLLHFRSAEGLGDLLAARMLGLAFLTFLMILLLSNVITALSTFFLSRDLELLVASPADPLHVYWARLVESGVNSSWMVVLLLVPLLAGYGAVYGAGPGFYLLAVGVVVPFLVIPAVLGAGVTLLLVSVFPARRTRDLLALIGLMAAAGVVLLLRLLQPERLVRPEEARGVMDFLSTLRTPTSPWLPSEWAAQALLGWLTGGFEIMALLLLGSTAAALVVLGGWAHTRYFPGGFSRAQEGAERKESRVRSGSIEAWFPRLSPAARHLVAKEIRSFFRDSTQWSQLILLGVLVVVYVYNIRVLPMGAGEGVSFFLVNVVAFLNLGLAGFVVAAVAARFIFPAMSLEGRMTWLLRSSPLDPRLLFWSKYWTGTLPLLAVALPLIVITNLLLGVDPFLFWLSLGTMVSVTLALSALALTFGALFPNYETENPAEIPTSFGGLLFMMTAVAYLAAVIVLQGWPVYLFLRARLDGAGATDAGLGPVVLGVGGAALLTLLIVWVALQTGIRSIRDTEAVVMEGAA